MRHIGYMFANVAVMEEVDEGLAALVLARAEVLTWRQFVILAAVGRKDRLQLPEGDLGDDPGAWQAWGARREFRDLYEQGFFGAPGRTTQRMGLSIPNTSIHEQRLAHPGQLLQQLLSLDLDDGLKRQICVA